MPPKLKTNKIGLTMLTASVAGNMMGSGIFLLPATLANIGSIAIFGWLLSLCGACALSLVFAKLGMLIPKAGGPYAFARHSFGNYLGFQTAFVYWTGAWIGNIAVTIVAIGYLSFFFPFLHNPIIGCLTGIGMIWFFIFLNLYGPRSSGRIQLLATSIMLIPILCTATLGWFWFDKTIFLNSFRTSEISTFAAMSNSVGMTLWAFLGVETACVNAGAVENPSKTIPLATVFGIILAGAAYILSSSVIMGIIPAHELAKSSSPFSLLATTLIGPKAGAFVSICAIIACVGTLCGWIMVIAQISKAASDDGLFPKSFGIINKRNAPYRGLFWSGILMSILFITTLSQTIAEHFTTLSKTSAFMIVLPYVYSCASLFIIIKSKLQFLHEKIIYSLAAIISSIYSLLAIIGLGEKIMFYGTLTIFLTIGLYWSPVFSAQIFKKYRAPLRVKKFSDLGDV